MKFAILGAGGIGCYYGARLAAAGHDVVFVARGLHLKAMQSQGLSVTQNDFSFNSNVIAVDLDTLMSEFNCEEFDLLILAAKSAATKQIMGDLSDWLSSGSTPVLSIQNGVRNEEKIAAVVGKMRTLGGLAVRIGGHIVNPGVVQVTGVAEIEMGIWPNSRVHPDSERYVNSLGSVFNESGIPTSIQENIEYALWKKLIINNSVNPLSALTGLDTRQMLAEKSLRNVVYQMMLETAKAANYAGVEIVEKDVDEMFDLISNFAAIKTSMLVDREKGRPLELDDICGPVLDYYRINNNEAKTTSLIKTLLESNLHFCAFNVS
ncbi:ketopantoate reductase family protein [Vibrio salinus]|uniref:ketopantoate reductase family protein n=1 Tax=Vibrio salinus TaxID=2899784 RepID=UPI001E360CBF|nr:2-dehydropantoate 2-reductase [Vibrio salinus]MCE0492585.1 2-dehydropantoate 2-reductase [Vibrio salinus]